MKRIFIVMSALLVLASCEIEELTPADVVLEDTTQVVTEEPVVDPASIEVPCVLVPDVFRLNFSNYGVASIDVSTLGSTIYQYTLDLDGTFSELEIKFASKPGSGYYVGKPIGSSADEGEFGMRILLGGYYYYSNEGSNLYVQDYGDSTVVSWCDVDFVGPEGTLPEAKGNFTYYE